MAKALLERKASFSTSRVGMFFRLPEAKVRYDRAQRSGKSLCGLQPAGKHVVHYPAVLRVHKDGGLDADGQEFRDDDPKI